MPQPWREARYLHMTQMAERITKVHHQLKHDHNDPFNMNCARFFTLDANLNLSIISSCKDIYDGFEDLEKRTRSPQMVRMKYLGIETCGWAAPLNNEDDGEADQVRPSEHEHRRRCRLLALIDRNLDVASIVLFQDDPEDIIVDNGKAQGLLDEALKRLMACIIYEQATSN